MSTPPPPKPPSSSSPAALAPYARVKQHLKERLTAGEWAPGAQLPSEAELVAQFGISRMTANRALRELQADGLVQRVQGVGTFAAPLHRVSATLTLRDLHEEIAERGHRHSAEVHLQRAEPASAELAAEWGLAPGAPVFRTLIVHFENGVALQCEDRFVNPAEAPDYLAQDFTRTTPTHYLFQATTLWRAQYAIVAAQPTAQEAKLLGLARTDACLIVHRRTFSRDAPITTARLVHPGHRFQLDGQFTP